MNRRAMRRVVDIPWFGRIAGASRNECSGGGGGNALFRSHLTHGSSKGNRRKSICHIRSCCKQQNNQHSRHCIVKGFCFLARRSSTRKASVFWRPQVSNPVFRIVVSLSHEAKVIFFQNLSPQFRGTEENQGLPITTNEKREFNLDSAPYSITVGKRHPFCRRQCLCLFILPYNTNQWRVTTVDDRPAVKTFLSCLRFATITYVENTIEQSNFHAHHPHYNNMYAKRQPQSQS